MKVGILTFHCACNYGAVLQCYALQTYLSSAGHDVRVIDYRPRSVSAGYRWFDIRRFWGATPARFIRKTSSEMKVISSRRRRYRMFGRFVSERLALSDRVRSAGDMAILARDYDMLIVGSDQVWNTGITGGIDRIYWGDFARTQKTAIVSYAASMENGINEEARQAVTRLLPGFRAISVREKSLKESLSGLLPDIDIRVTADPTLLLDREQWDGVSGSPHVEEPYLLFYQVRNSKEALAAASKVASSRGLKLVVLSAKVELENSPEVVGASPLEFVSLFRNASYVVTTSFHGTVFSLIYEKEFICVDVADGKSSRQADLLACVGLSDRTVSSADDVPEGNIDWSRVRKSVRKLRQESFDYLKDCGL